MKPKRMNRECGNGRLPASAPLANPYVPFQMEDPPKYEARYGLIRGTMFPGLDLPFQGRSNQKELNVTPTTELQALAFAIQELALYLDTHAEDAEALEVYRQLQKMYHDGVTIYEETNGPLTHNSPVCGPYKWLNDPWPWEYAKNREV